MKRLVFANHLRGLAALSVAIVHLIGVFWLARDVVSSVTFTPAQTGPNDPMIALVVHPWFNFGAFGVGLFFLISGLVIPVSLGEHTARSFLVARALRIYPLYAAALLLEMAVVAGNSAWWGIPFTVRPWTVLSNALLIHDLVGQPSLDLVNWTLCVELRFYLVMALAAPLVRRGSVALLFALAALACLLNVVVGQGVFGPPVPDPVLMSYTVSTETLFGCFMLVGVLFNYHLRGLLGWRGLVLSVVGMMALFAACWTRSVLAYQFPDVTKNYACALVLFGALYAVRDRVPPSRLLNALAAISFPFYCLHSLIGYSVLRWFVVGGHVAFPAALAATFATVAVLATGLHVLVERPTVRLGKRLRRDLAQAGAQPWAARSHPV